jgi:hypothetical protein
VIIHLPAEMDSVVTEAAEKRGTTPDALVEEFVRERLQPEEPPPQNGNQGKTLADFLHGYVGVFDSRDDVPGGAKLSIDTGKQFAEGMVRKHAQGHL